MYTKKKLHAKNKAFVDKLCSVFWMDVAMPSGLGEEIIQGHCSANILTDKLVLNCSAGPQNFRICTRKTSW